jgi:hypothetical protein
MVRQARQNTVDFQPHRIDVYSSLYLFYTSLWKNQRGSLSKSRHGNDQVSQIKRENVVSLLLDLSDTFLQYNWMTHGWEQCFPTHKFAQNLWSNVPAYRTFKLLRYTYSAQFHQHFTRAFFAVIVLPKSHKAKL